MPRNNYIFVDFENVPDVDLKHAPDDSTVVLVIGKNQKKFGLEIVKEATRMADRLELVEVGVAGRNALDLTLASYFGRTVAHSPDAGFTIISRDKDFDAMIAHWVSKGVKITRNESLKPPATASASKPAKTGKTKPPFEEPTAAKPGVPNSPKSKDKFQTLAAVFKATPQHCPKKLAPLLKVIDTHFAKKLPEGGAEAVVTKLEKAGVIRVIDGVVFCPPFPK